MTAQKVDVALSPFGQIDSKQARKHEGAGLGLPICVSLTELHGGDLTIMSQPGAGTTITAPPATQALPRLKLSPDLACRPHTVLV